jgi:signal transduction histidine kinase
VIGLAFSGDQKGATILYRNESRRAYNDASDALGALTAVSVEQADEASRRAARAYRSGRISIIAAVLLAGTMLGAALFYIRNWISLPMTRLAHTMRLLAANRTNLEIEGTDRGDEIGDMARAVQVFRSNAIELIQSQHGLAQQAGMLEQKLAYEKELTRLQRNFVSMISHEFRTPLTAIDAHAQRLNNMKEHIQPKDLEDRARRIRSAVQRITSLLDNLLNTSRLMDGKAELFFHPTEFDMVSVLQDVCAFHREISPNAIIIEDFGAEKMPFHGDQKLLYQTFSNLLSNAIKYSADEVLVEVSARQDEGAAVIAFRDRGLGIPQKDLGILFVRYYRGSNVSGIVGTGIGLYLAKMVVDMHGGEISVASQEGRGSCFTISLPRQAGVQTGNVCDREKGLLF